jgi:hypothetical protein
MVSKSMERFFAESVTYINVKLYKQASAHPVELLANASTRDTLKVAVNTSTYEY